MEKQQVSILYLNPEETHCYQRLKRDCGITQETERSVDVNSTTNFITQVMLECMRLTC